MEAFHSIVKKAFSNWTALQLAIQHCSGIAEGREKEKYMAESIVEFFQNNNNLYPDEVEDLLMCMLDFEFNAQAEDNSVSELSKLFCECFHLCQEGKVDETTALFPATLQQSALKNCVPFNNDTNEESIAAPVQEMNQLNMDQSSNSGNNAPKMDEDGWTTVTKKG